MLAKGGQDCRPDRGRYRSLSKQGKLDAAEVIQQATWATQKQVLGVDHPNTLLTAGNLRHTIAKQSCLIIMIIAVSQKSSILLFVFVFPLQINAMI